MENTSQINARQKKHHKKNAFAPNMVACVYNPNIWEAEARGFL